MVRTFEGRRLDQVRFPLGGIGTGTVSLGGRGELRDWEIWNHPGKGKDLPYTFFALWARPEGGGEATARVLEARQGPPYAGGHGIPTRYAPGLPRLRGARFEATYPVARIVFDDDALPVAATLDAWNPLVPLDVDASALPVAHFRWTLTNPGLRPVAVSVAFSLLNAAGYDGHAALGNRHAALFGRNENAWRDDGTVRGLRMTTGKYDPGHPQFGSLAVLTPHPDVTFLRRWERAGWWDDLQAFWDDFADDGRLPSDPGPAAGDPSPDGETDVGTLALRATVAPGASVALPFVLAWHVPNLTNTWNGEEAVRGQAPRERLRGALRRRLGRRGVRRPRRRPAGSGHAPFRGNHGIVHAAARGARRLHVADRHPALHDLPPNRGRPLPRLRGLWRHRRLLSHELHACLELCVDARQLFPSLERTMRETDFASNTRPTGDMAFRTLLPLQTGALWEFVPAADGQMGTVLRLYREWTQHGGQRAGCAA
jgi:hypothetical protein